MTIARAFGIVRKFTFALSLSLAAACQAPPDQATESSAVVMTGIRAGSPLDEILQLLDNELVQAMAGGMEGEAFQHFRRAEAISDRLLEARLPFEWITAEQYSLKARLRQIQSSADRVLAEVVTGAPREQMLLDLRQLRADVVRLRQVVATGGGRAPPELEQLLADTLRSRASRPRPAPGPDSTAVPATTTRDG